MCVLIIFDIFFCKRLKFNIIIITFNTQNAVSKCNVNMFLAEINSTYCNTYKL